MCFMQNPEGSADFNRRKRFLLLGYACAVTSVKCIFLRARAAVQLWNFLLLCFFGQGPCATATLHRRHRGTNRHFQLTRLLNPPLPPHRLWKMFTSALKCCTLPRRYPGDGPLLSGTSSDSKVNYILGPWMAQMLYFQALPSASTCTLRRLSRQ